MRKAVKTVGSKLVIIYVVLFLLTLIFYWFKIIPILLFITSLVFILKIRKYKFTVKLFIILGLVFSTILLLYSHLVAAFVADSHVGISPVKHNCEGILINKKQIAITIAFIGTVKIYPLNFDEFDYYGGSFGGRTTCLGLNIIRLE